MRGRDEKSWQDVFFEENEVKNWILQHLMFLGDGVPFAVQKKADEFYTKIASQRTTLWKKTNTLSEV